MRRVLVVAAAVTPAVLAVLLGLGTAVYWWATSEPEDEWARFTEATEVQELVIAVERDRERVRSGKQTTYTIAVGNRGQAAQPVTVRASVPPWLTPTGATADNGYVEWSLVVPPGGVETTRLVGVYAAPRSAADPAGGAAPVVGTPQRVTFTACALDQAAGEPIVCDTDATHLAAPISGSSLGWLALGAGTLAVATAVAAATVIRAGTLRRVADRLPRWRRAARGP
ncbi:hypothetical protein JQS43_19820 [Natronosporangium hydrolyticum]|uniref:DUF11 domain-containing protein n=1 Tax=Natronosporangium hydrolyticum TaxID=2811111 RepID=A0A895YC00_9ACTN|nr:hypothetical protein [Natronosporangium hydrolyticum]QSB13785.1 hypothetical protein JQS43_19820 [Natronosporangium hydrolyticum]